MRINFQRNMNDFQTFVNTVNGTKLSARLVIHVRLKTALID